MRKAYYLIISIIIIIIAIFTFSNIFFHNPIILSTSLVIGVIAPLFEILYRAVTSSGSFIFSRNRSSVTSNNTRTNRIDLLIGISFIAMLTLSFAFNSNIIPNFTNSSPNPLPTPSIYPNPTSQATQVVLLNIEAGCLNGNNLPFHVTIVSASKSENSFFLIITFVNTGNRTLELTINTMVLQDEYGNVYNAQLTGEQILISPGQVKETPAIFDNLQTSHGEHLTLNWSVLLQMSSSESTCIFPSETIGF